jgi:hypothetical protein
VVRPRTADPREKVEEKRERKKEGETEVVGGWGVIGGHMSDSSCANIDVNNRVDIELLVG